PLTWAIGSGTGRKLPVDDGMPFYDGFGIEGEQGDWIAVGSGDNVAQIERVELRYYQPAILHLDREITWDNRAPVSLPWAGEAPDIGAFERGLEYPSRVIASGRPAAPEPGEPVQFSVETQGGEVESILWDFDDGTVSREPEPTHTFERAGQYGVTVRATFADGSRSVDCFFVKVEEPVEPYAPFVEADFEDETRLTRWGHHFKFYRGHQTGFARVERPDGEGKCMHLFYDAKKRNRSTADMAPGAWNIDKYPILSFDYRIPEGVPLALEVTTFQAPDRPDGFVLGGTETRAARHEDLNEYQLIDDGEWHTIEIDVRKVREVHPELKHLRQFIFYTNWNSDEGQEFWFDNFYILPE
ncbi:MAG: PKD domain-containing protein, partial [Armatimonadota bacterium]